MCVVCGQHIVSSLSMRLDWLLALLLLRKYWTQGRRAGDWIVFTKHLTQDKSWRRQILTDFSSFTFLIIWDIYIHGLHGDIIKLINLIFISFQLKRNKIFASDGRLHWVSWSLLDWGVGTIYEDKRKNISSMNKLRMIFISGCLSWKAAYYISYTTGKSFMSHSLNRP